MKFYTSTIVGRGKVDERMTAALLDSTLDLFSIKWSISQLLNIYTVHTLYNISTIVTSPKITRFINQSFKPHHDATLLSCYDVTFTHS